MGEREQQLAGRDPAEEVLALVGGARGRDQAARQHHAGQERLRGDHAPQLLGDDADLDRAGADAAVVLGVGQPEQAHLGHPLPLVLVEARVLVDGPPPLLVVGVGLAGQPAHGIAQRFLLVVVGEVHVSAPPQSPRMVLAMICRWTSLEPP